MIKPQATILITRPHGQHEHLKQLCEQFGLSVLHLPCLAIEGLNPDSLSRDRLDRADTILFTSRNAVEHANRLLTLPWPDKSVHAIGSATQAALCNLNQPVALVPEEPFNSEAYLKQLLQHPAQRLLIIKGSGGRDLINKTLSQRGWLVDTIDVYRRTLPELPEGYIHKLFEKALPDLVSVTSNEALINLKKLAHHHWPALLEKPLVVNSERTLTLAKTLGFKSEIMVASPAGDLGQASSIRRWLAE